MIDFILQQTLDLPFLLGKGKLLVHISKCTVHRIVINHIEHCKSKPGKSRGNCIPIVANKNSIFP